MDLVVIEVEGNVLIALIAINVVIVVIIAINYIDDLLTLLKHLILNCLNSELLHIIE